LLSNTRKMYSTSLWTQSVTLPAPQMLSLQAYSWDSLKMMNGDYAQNCIVSYKLQLSSHLFQLSRSKNCLYKCTTHIYCIPPIKQTRLYKNTKPTNDYHALLPKNIFRNSCFYTHKPLYNSNRQHRYKVKKKNIVFCCYLEVCTTSIIVKYHSILENKNYKLPSSKMHAPPGPTN
jgi:hypothetical protein